MTSASTSIYISEGARGADTARAHLSTFLRYHFKRGLKSY